MRGLIGAVLAMLAGLCSAEANACMLIEYSRIERASQVVVEGRYFRDPSDEASGYVVPYRFERGERRDRYTIQWDTELLEDPIQGQCATQIPTNGRYERFYLIWRDAGYFEMIGRAGAKDPDEPEETDG